MVCDIPSDRLSVFCDGLVKVLVDKVEAEKKLNC